MKQLCLIAALPWLILACGQEQGLPIQADRLGYQTCDSYYACGQGRFCNPDGFCAAECRTTPDCRLVTGADGAWVCNLFGQCLNEEADRVCARHADCGPLGFCNGTCSTSQARCGGAEDCPLDGESCAGTCAAPCRTDGDCGSLAAGLSCTPVGRCLLPGWERWISPGELPPTGCTTDSQCKALGFGFLCSVHDGAAGVCKSDGAPVSLGQGPVGSPAHAFRGVWGLRLNLAVETLGLPLLNRQTTNVSHLFLVLARHDEGDRLRLTEKLCEMKMINFSDTGQAPSDLIHVTIPLSFLAAIPLVERTVDLPQAEVGSPWSTSSSTENRGCQLANPAADPLPTRKDYEADPVDDRFFDQDGDGRPGMTTLTDGVLRGEIYIVQRIQLAQLGSLVDVDHIGGLIQAVTEEHIISSNKQSLVYDIDTAVHPDQQRTWFRMQRLDPDASCADLIRLADRPESWLRQTDRLGDLNPPPGF